jgi:hypothetical protein
MAAATRGDLADAGAAIWGDTTQAEIEERLERQRAGVGISGFADEAQATSGDIPVRIMPDERTIPDALRSVAMRAAFGIWDKSGVLTRNHAASSYGQFILLVDGVAHGIGDAVYPQGVAGLLFHPNPAPEWRSAEFEAALLAAQAQGWHMLGESW